MKPVLSLKSWIWPCAFAALLGAFFIFTHPGDPYHADAYEYQQLGRSIQRGEYALGGAPSMQREPGYPLLIASVYALVGYHPRAVLCVQLLLLIVTMWLVKRTLDTLEPRLGVPVLWFLALVPEWSHYASVHLAEMLAAFFLSLGALAWVSLRQRDRTFRSMALWAFALGLIWGAAMLTRAVYELLPLVSVASCLSLKRLPWPRRVSLGILVLIGSMIVAGPWVSRNERVFGQPAITFRTGIVTYTRAIKAEAAWSRLAASYASVVIGHSLLERLEPAAQPIINAAWKNTWQAMDAELAQGKTAAQADHALLQAAGRMIFSTPGVFARYLLWSPIDVLRLSALPSVLSPDFSIEATFIAAADAHHLSWMQIVALVGLDLIQLLWWGCLVVGLGSLMRLRDWFHPAFVLVAYTFLLYAPFDDIPRYAVPVLPWMAFLMCLGAARWWQKMQRAS